MSDLILHRILNAPRSAVYACWTTPEHMVHWFMPQLAQILPGRSDFLRILGMGQMGA